MNRYGYPPLIILTYYIYLHLLFILLYKNICITILENTTLINCYTFAIKKMCIYYIMQTQYEYVNKDIYEYYD
jgi:hypothetical protein